MPSSSAQRARQAADQMIRTEEQATAAVARIEELSGCLEGSTEEIELISLVFAIEVWEAKQLLR